MNQEIKYPLNNGEYWSGLDCEECGDELIVTTIALQDSEETLMYDEDPLKCPCCGYETVVGVNDDGSVFACDASDPT